MEIKERVYIIDTSGCLKRDGYYLNCPFDNPPSDYPKGRCGDHCPAFQVDTTSGEAYVHLKCFPHPVTYKIKEV